MTTDHRQIARDISYSGSAASRGGRALIKVIENITGRPSLIRRAEGYDTEVAAGRDFWSVMVERYGLSLHVSGGALENIPAQGPLIVIANHPYGVLDGLMMGHILHRTRGDFRILANRVFQKARDLDEVLLPISFDETKEGVAQNLETRRRTLAYLAAGGCVGIFPGGTVSTALKPFGQPMDPGWRGFTARMIARSGATVVPVFFAGHTSRLFQLASHVHANLRLGLLLKEFRARVDSPVEVVIGAPIPPEEIAARAKDTKAMMDFLRKATYELSPKPLKSYEYGFEFEERHRAARDRKTQD
ncbi:lysophospholipid acyltransferase family protein [Pseudooceanicola nanhaiensis]|uniref:lysophospholipid acyltransferase family protein n=1 Tax=Pseudooceanicola nanhaiensis TaxID=375761 RepID=UPI001CD7A163|nr:lysophospholipid acyltransferase family protein [Pseudooceanicola nanhaiensis]MCA0920023.1 lysophospholipid acyltransferase family protein [Pseudooceanicola nanhaiensis]